MGVDNGFNEPVLSSEFSSVTVAASAAFTTSDDGLKGHNVTIYEGTGAGQSRVILNNTSATVYLEANWNQKPDTTSKITIGGIDAYWRSKDYSFESEHITKLFKEIDIRFKEQGKIDLDLYYIVNFNRIDGATLKKVRMHAKAMVWGDEKTGLWGSDRWGSFSVISRRILMRPTKTQSLYGTHIAFRFGNSRANEEFRIAGFDIVKKDVGRR